MAVVKAIVRGPEDYFDGSALRAPGSVVEVDEAFVSTEDFFEVEAEVKLEKPALNAEGELVLFAKTKIRKRVMFRPLTGVEQAIDTAPEPMIAQPDRLNITDFLKNGVAEIVAKIETGEIDDFLDAIAMAESQDKGRKTVTDAIAERMNKA